MARTKRRKQKPVYDDLTGEVVWENNGRDHGCHSCRVETRERRLERRRKRYQLRREAMKMYA